MAVGFNLELTLAAGKYSPVCRRSASGNLTMGSGGSVITIPWVGDAGSDGSAETSSADIKVALQAATAAFLNDLAANGVPT